MNNIIKELKDNKIKIHWNKNPIPMNLFLSFLTIETDRSKTHLGSDNGWTKLFNLSKNLEITGGFVNGVEYLDSIQYGKNLSNPYNNFVNPFYLFDIMNDEGKKFFFDYYKEDIIRIRESEQEDIEINLAEIKKKELYIKEIDSFINLYSEPFGGTILMKSVPIA